MTTDLQASLDFLRNSESCLEPTNGSFTWHQLRQVETQPQSRLSHFNSGPKTANNWLKGLPIIVAFLLLVGILTIVLIFATPSLLINHFVQTLTDRFNYQATSFEARSNLILDSKWQSNQPPSEYKIINQYRTMPDTLAKNMEQEGFTIKTDQQQIKEVFFKHQPISRQDFLRKISSDVDINKAKNDSFNSKRVVFQDDVWQKNAHNLRLSKKGFTTKKTADKQAIIDDFKQQELAITKVQEPETRFNTSVPTETDQDGNSHEQDSPSISIFKSINNNLSYINQQADQLSSDKQTPYRRKFDNLKLVESNFVNQQSACGLYHNNLFLQNYAKTSQAEQQSQLALNLFVEAEKIKAGLATPESVSFYGDRLTEKFIITKANGTKVETLSATDSQGYKYAAYGDNVSLNENAQRYVLGANPSVANSLQMIRDNNPQCQETGFFKKFFRSILNNIANLLKPFTLNLPKLNDLLNTGSDRQMTENTLAAMSNLKVAPDTSGEDLGNAIVSGTGYFMGKNAAIRGNNILSKKQAITYLQDQAHYLALQAEIDRKYLSPLDASSNNTLIGSIVASNLHLFTEVSSIRNLVTSVVHSAKISLFKLQPTSYAAPLKLGKNRCEDSEFLKLNRYFNGEEIALDPFCNPFYGVDPQYKKLTPEQVVLKLVASGDLVKADPDCQEDCELIPNQGLANYQKNCINRAKLPIGDQDDELELDDGESCLANSPQKALYGIFFIDQGVQRIFDEIKPLS